MLDLEIQLPRPAALAGRVQGWSRRRQVLLGAAVIYGAMWAFSDFRWWRPERFFDAGDNANIGEGRSWLHGRLDLIIDAVALKHTPTADRPFDTALYDGRVYNVFPPLLSLLSAPILLICPQGVPHPLLTAVCGLLLPALAYAVFVRCTARLRDAVLMTLVYLLGTSVTRVIDQAVRLGYIWHLNHALANIGLLLFLLEYYGRRRVWLAGAGVMAACWARQLTFAYALPLLWMARNPAPRADTPQPVVARPGRRRRTWLALAMTAGMVGVPATLSALKFGSPWESGYRYLYEGRDDRFARSARHGIFSTDFFAHNLYYMNVGPPRVGIVRGRANVLRRLYINPNSIASGIWWTTPLLLYILIDLPSVWRDPRQRWLIVASGLVLTALLFYHTIGEWQKGYNRFSTDFMAPLLTIVAARLTASRRRLTWALVLWSVVYFQWFVPDVT